MFDDSAEPGVYGALLAARVDPVLAGIEARLGQPRCQSDPNLVDDGSVVDRLVELQREKATRDAEELVLLAELQRRATGWITEPRFSTFALSATDVAADEVAAALCWAPVTAMGRVHFAHTVTTRLPATLAALAAGDIDMIRVRAIADATAALCDDDVCAVEQAVLAKAVRQTPGQLRAALRRAVLAVDPTAAETRRQAAEGRPPRPPRRRKGRGHVPVGAAQSRRRPRRLQPSGQPRPRLRQRRPPHHGPTPRRRPHRHPPRPRTPAPPHRPCGRRRTGPRPAGRGRADPGHASTRPPGGPRAEPRRATTRPSGRGRADPRRADRQRHGDDKDPDADPATPHAADDDNDNVFDDRLTGEDSARDDDGWDDYLHTEVQLEELIRNALTRAGLDDPAPDEPAPGSALARLELIVTAGILAGHSSELAELTGYGPVSAAMARELALRPDITIRHREHLQADAAGLATTVLPQHDPSERMATVVRVRDGTCRFPSCRAPARRCDIDHTIRYPDGPTAIWNLACLCRRHHRLKHEAGWHLVQHAHGILEWTSPTGHIYTTHPSGPLDRREPDPD